MKFIELDKNDIINHSVYNDGFYEYTIGSPVEITSIKSGHMNNIMAKNLSSDCKEDSLMVKYSPTNTIYFSEEFIKSVDNYVSFNIENNKLYIGTASQFGSDNGILVFSGYFSANRLIEQDRPILCTPKMKATIMSSIRVLSLGVLGDKLCGLFYIPATKGLKVSTKKRGTLGISPINYKETFCNNYEQFTIKDWFDLAKIEEI